MTHSVTLMTNIWIELHTAYRNLKRQRNRTIVAVLTLATGLIAYLLAGGFIEWIFHGMRETTIRSQLGHIQIVRPGYMDKGRADPYSFILPQDSSHLGDIAKTPGVINVAQRLTFSGLVSFRDNTVSFIGEGIEPEREAVISDQIYIRAGKNLSHSSEHSALLGEGLAKAIGASPGDSIVLLATTASGSPNAIEVTVAGTFYTSSKEYDDNALRLPIDLTRKLMRVKGATSWVMLLDSTPKTEQIGADLRHALDSKQFQVVTWHELADFYNKTVALFAKQVYFMKLIIGIIIILTISNTQTMTVLERTTEIGTMMALGTTQTGVLRQFVLEGCVIGLIGGILGIIIGYLLAQIISAIGIPMPPPPGMETGFVAEILVTHSLILDAFFLAVLTALLASILPALKASRLNVVDALRCNQ